MSSLGIPTQLKLRWNEHLKSLASLIQNHAGSLIAHKNKITPRSIEVYKEQIETACSILKLYYPLFPLYLSDENKAWLDTGHECMLKSHMIPSSIRNEFKTTTNRIIFIGLRDNSLEFYFVDGFRTEIKLGENMNG